MDYSNVTISNLKEKFKNKIPDESQIDFEEGIYTNLATDELDANDMDSSDLGSKNISPEKLKQFGRQVED